MPNWCSHSCVVRGEKKEIDILYQRMLNAQRKASVAQTWWTYELAIEHGYKREEILDDNSFGYIGGSLDNINAPEFNGKDWHILFDMTTRWSPCNRMLDEKIFSQYMSLRSVHIAEECGCEIYMNTDIEGEFFPDKYCIYDDDFGSEYFASDSQLIKYLKDTYNKDIPLVAELKDDDDIKIKRGKTIRFHRFVAY